ncbi:hypothetical protein [Microbacterium sp. NPDC080220]|uniref:hypothetical protein n=1 Tax=Microbacterium sp. NPDC080220 TaxID=3161017 RepID=UPI003431B252
MMKALIGLAQLGLGVYGVIAIFTGQWGAAIVCWLGAFSLGFLGLRLTRRSEGASQLTFETVERVHEAIAALRSGRYDIAKGKAAIAVRNARIEGNSDFLPIVLTLSSVTLAANEEFEQARTSMRSAERSFSNLSNQQQLLLRDIRAIMSSVRRQLDEPVPNGGKVVEAFLQANVSGAAG